MILTRDAIVIENYIAAYKAANGSERAIEVSYSDGWFLIRTIGLPSRYRRKQIVAMTETLKARANGDSDA